MRITSGIHGGRQLQVPRVETIRPTQDRVRQAVFSSLGERVVGAAVLDLFAGTGAMGLEALSRGAARVTWVERDREVLRALRANLDRILGGMPAGCLVLGDDVFRQLPRAAAAAGPYDLVFADPPYDRARGAQWLARCLEALEAPGLLHDRSLFFFETAAGLAAAERAGWRLVGDRRYGGTRMLVYHHGEASGRPDPETPP
jgi:16S rRNA (guanine966-N2)-methyltransferase